MDRRLIKALVTALVPVTLLGISLNVAANRKTETAAPKAADHTLTITISSYAEAHAWTAGTDIFGFIKTAGGKYLVIDCEENGEHYGTLELTRYGENSGMYISPLLGGGPNWNMDMSDDPDPVLTLKCADTFCCQRITFTYSGAQLTYKGTACPSGEAITFADGIKTADFPIANTGSTDETMAITIIEILFADAPLASGLAIATDPVGINTAKTGDIVQMTALLTPVTASYAVAWETSDATLAKIDAAGRLTMLKVGTVQVRARTTDGSDILSEPLSITIEEAAATDIVTWTMETIMSEEGLTANEAVTLIPLENLFTATFAKGTGSKDPTFSNGEVTMSQNNTLTIAPAYSGLTDISVTLAFTTSTGFSAGKLVHGDDDGPAVAGLPVPLTGSSLIYRSSGRGTAAVKKITITFQASYLTIASAWRDHYLHLNDYPRQAEEDPGWCRDAEHGYYQKAKAALLRKDEQHPYLTSRVLQEEAELSAAKERYEAWGRANGDGMPYLDETKTLRTGQTLKTGSLFLAFGIAVTFFTYAVSGLIILKKKRQTEC